MIVVLTSGIEKAREMQRMVEHMRVIEAAQKAILTIDDFKKVAEGLVKTVAEFKPLEIDFKLVAKELNLDSMYRGSMDIFSKHVFGNIRGGVIGWCFSRYDGYSERLKYYKTTETAIVFSQCNKQAFKGLSGCPPMNRGRHFDRKRRC